MLPARMQSLPQKRKVRKVLSRENIYDSLFNYYDRLTNVLGDTECCPEFATVVMKLEEAWEKGSTVFMCGNGGSSSTCSHMANDFQKGLATTKKLGLKMFPLTDNGPLISSYANDVSWYSIFGMQLVTWMKEGDLFIGLSGSGNSQNVLNAVTLAKSCGVYTIGLSGMGGGKLARNVDLSIVTPSQNMQIIEDHHHILLHSAFSILGSKI